MGSVPPLLTFLLMVVSGWVHRRQLIVIEFLQAENRLLKERLRGKRIRFGVISLLGVEQALLIEEMLRRRLSPSTFARHRLLCGNAAQFQGDERDVVWF